MTEKKKEKKRSPFLRLWNGLGVLGGILSLSSLAQTWTSDLIEWQGFLAGLTENYRAAIEPVFAKGLGWLPFQVPLWVNDYVVLGLVAWMSGLKAVGPGSGTIKLHDWFQITIMLLPVYVLIWPLITLYSIWVAASKNYVGTHWENVYENCRSYLHWVLTVILGLVILLSLNSALQ